MAFGVGYAWWFMGCVILVFGGREGITVLCLFFLILCLLHATGIAKWLDEIG